MSALLKNYSDRFPDRCKTCPVFLAFLNQAELAENAATKHTRDIEGIMRGQSVSRGPMDEAEIKVQGTYLDMSTELELWFTRAVARLVEGSEECPGDPNANELYIFPLGTNIVGTVRQSSVGSVCQNPNLDSAIAETGC